MNKRPQLGIDGECLHDTGEPEHAKQEPGGPDIQKLPRQLDLQVLIDQGQGQRVMVTCHVSFSWRARSHRRNNESKQLCDPLEKMCGSMEEELENGRSKASTKSSLAWTVRVHQNLKENST